MMKLIWVNTSASYTPIIISTDINSLPVMSSNIYQGTNSRAKLRPSITEVDLIINLINLIIYVKFHSNLAGVNEIWGSNIRAFCNSVSCTGCFLCFEMESMWWTVAFMSKSELSVSWCDQPSLLSSCIPDWTSSKWFPINFASNVNGWGYIVPLEHIYETSWVGSLLTIADRALLRWDRILWKVSSSKFKLFHLEMYLWSNCHQNTTIRWQIEVLTLRRYPWRSLRWAPSSLHHRAGSIC